SFGRVGRNVFCYERLRTDFEPRNFLTSLLGTNPTLSLVVASSVFLQRTPPSSLLRFQRLILPCSAERHRWDIGFGLCFLPHPHNAHEEVRAHLVINLTSFPFMRGLSIALQFFSFSLLGLNTHALLADQASTLLAVENGIGQFVFVRKGAHFFFPQRLTGTPSMPKAPRTRPSAEAQQS